MVTYRAPSRLKSLHFVLKLPEGFIAGDILINQCLGATLIVWGGMIVFSGVRSPKCLPSLVLFLKCFCSVALVRLCSIAHISSS